MSVNKSTIITIDSERIKVCGSTSTTFIVCTGGRGFDGSTATTHQTNATVSGFYTAYNGNASAAEIIALEQYVQQDYLSIAKFMSGPCQDGVDQNSAVQQALAVSHRIYIPPGCTWVLPLAWHGDIPGSLSYFTAIKGGDPVTSVIKANADPTMSGMGAGPQVLIYNMNLLSNSTCGFEFTVCPLLIYANFSKVKRVIINNGYKLFRVETRDELDYAGADITTNNGDAFFGANTPGSAAAVIRLWNQDPGSNSEIISCKAPNTFGSLWWSDTDLGAASGADVNFFRNNTGAKDFIRGNDGNNVVITGDIFTWSMGSNFTGHLINYAHGGPQVYAVNYDGSQTLGGVSFSALAGLPWGNGTLTRCTNCASPSNPCTAGASDTLAFKSGGVWKCF